MQKPIMSDINFQRLTTTKNMPENLLGAVVAIGNFDGVHRGHQAVLQTALDQAAQSGRPALALTFEPHPRSFFKPDEPVDRLTPAAEKAELLKVLGFDAVIELPFTKEFSALSAEDFVSEILVDDLQVAQVVTGYDFHFGKARRGTPDFLTKAGQATGFKVTLVEAFCDEGGERISSSRIRDYLGEGDVVSAAGMLGYHYQITAEVVHGKKLGRTLGFPTANMCVPKQTNLKHGIYAAKFRRQDGSLLDGVASFGRRPTVMDAGAPLLETFLFDFSGDLYGEIATVSFFSYLRGEVKFDGLEPLIAQMQLDEAEARAFLTNARPVSPLDQALNFTCYGDHERGK